MPVQSDYRRSLLLGFLFLALSFIFTHQERKDVPGKSVSEFTAWQQLQASGNTAISVAPVGSPDISVRDNNGAPDLLLSGRIESFSVRLNFREVRSLATFTPEQGSRVRQKIPETKKSDPLPVA
jgi:hypothetical protein